MQQAISCCVVLLSFKRDPVKFSGLPPEIMDSKSVFELFHCLQGVMDREDTTEIGTESRPNTGHSQSSESEQIVQVDSDKRKRYENDEEEEGGEQIEEMSEENSSSRFTERENSHCKDDRSVESGNKSPLGAPEQNSMLDEPSEREISTREEITEAVVSGIRTTLLCLFLQIELLNLVDLHMVIRLANTLEKYVTKVIDK